MPRHPEVNPQSSFETLYLYDLFETEQPLPVGAPDISFLRNLVQLAEPSAPGYAWEGVTGWMADVRDVRKSVAGPMLFVDACCSVPVFKQRGMASEFARCGANTRSIVRNVLLHEDSIMKLKANDPDVLPIAKALSRDQLGRILLESALQEALYGMTISQWENAELFRQSFFHKMLDHKAIYYQEKKRHETDTEAGWGNRFSVRESDQNYLEAVSALLMPTPDALAAGETLRTEYGKLQKLAHDRKSVEGREAARTLGQDAYFHSLVAAARQRLPAGRDRAARFIDWQSAMAAHAVVGNPKCAPTRFLSMDVLPPEEIALSSLAHTPLETQAMNLYPHAVLNLLDPGQHMVGDICKPLELPDNSVALFTIFDGYPYYERLKANSLAEAASFIDKTAGILVGIYKKLMFGGQLVIFPWELQEGGELADSVMGAIEDEVSKRIRQGIDLRKFHHEILLSWMSPSDRAIMLNKSSIFNSGSKSSKALIITKQRESQVNRSIQESERTFGWLAMLHQIRGLLDPKP